MPARPKVTFLAFFLRWAQKQGWEVPLLHVRACRWLETCDGRVRVLRIFRGAAKSTIYGVFKAWRLYSDPTIRNQVWAADGPLAMKMNRYTRHVLLTHPWCAGLLDKRAGVVQFWVEGATDFRNPSMASTGILSNATGSRADEVDFDDIEVPKNIRNVEARQALRERITESTHILVPGGRKTFIGTPHTHNSIYDEQIAGGAEHLTIPLFQHATRYEHTVTKLKYRFDFQPGPDGLYVIAGIGKFAKVLREGADYRVRGAEVVFDKPPGVVLDICAGNAWPERFTREEIEFKRRECRTLNEWDSQYQLQAKPLTEVRLDPGRMIEYSVLPRIEWRNKQPIMLLGATQIVGASAWWDCSLGKVTSDASAFCLVLTDQRGHLYWQVADGLVGELAEFGPGNRIIGGQVMQVRAWVEKFHIPRVTVETNGPGGFVPNILRQALKGLNCAVGEEHSKGNKQQRILDAFEPPLSSRFLWAHSSVLDGPVWDQMKDFNPAITTQPDDYLDSGAGAISATPVRIGRLVGNPSAHQRHDWRPQSGVHEVELEMS